MRLVRRLSAVLAWILVGLGALLLSVFAHLYSDLAERVGRHYALDFLDESFEGRFEVGRIARLSPSKIRLVDVAIYDPSGRKVLQVDEAVAEPDLRAILGGTILIDAVHVQGGHIRVLETPEGDISLVRAFDSVDPSPETDVPGPTVIVQDIRLRSLDISTDMAPVGLRDLSLDGDLRVEDDETTLHVNRTRAGIVREDHQAGTIDDLQAVVRTAAGAQSELTLLLRSGEDRVTLSGTAVLQPEDEGETGPRLDVRATLNPLSPATLRRAGLQDVAEQVSTSVRGTLDLAGTPQDLRLDAALHTDGGSLDVEARVESMQHLEATLETSGLELGRISPAAPAMRVGGTVALDVRGLMGDVRQVAIDLKQVSIDAYQIPSLHLESEVGPEQVRIEKLDLPYLDGEVDLRGRIGFDGEAQLDLHARIPNLAQEPNLRGLVPALGGALRADLELRHRPDPRPWVSARGEVTWTNARIATLRAARLHVGGKVRGELEQPRADVRLGARDLQVNDLALGDVRLSAEGGPRSYAVRLAVDAPAERRVRLVGRVQAAEGGYLLDASVLAVGILDHDWRGRIEEVVFVPDEQIRVNQLLLASGVQRLEVGGSYGLGRDPQVDMEASLQRLDLALLGALPGMDDLPIRGRVDLTATAKGNAEMPELTVEGAWTDGSAQGIPIDALVAYALWQPDQGHVASDIDVHLGKGYGHAALRVEGDLEPPVQDVEAAIMDGRYEVELTLDSLSAAIAEAAAPDAVPEDLGGHLSGSVIASGTLREFSLGATLAARELEAADFGPIDVDLTATSDEGMTRARVEVDQGGHALFRAWGGAAMGVPELVRNPESLIVRLKDEPWELHAEVPPQRLDELPAWAGVDLPALGWLRADVGHPADRPAEAHVRGAVTWLEGLAEGSPIDGGCAEGAKPRLSLQADVKEGQAEVELRGRMRGKQVLRARMQAPAPLNEWLAGELPNGPPPVQARARILEADLSRVPLVCEYASGKLSAELVATDLFTDSPSLELDAHVPDLVAMESPPMALDVNATADTEQLRARIRLDGRRTDQGASITASLPIAWGGENMVPSLREEDPMRADLRFDMTPLGPLLAPVPGIGYASGAIDGRVVVSGVGRSIRFDGALSLHDASASLQTAGNRLDDVRGRIVFDDQTIRLDRLHARDRDGRVILDGRFVMEGLSPREGQLHIDARDFPVRNAGVVIARVSTKTRVRMRFEEAEAQTVVGIDEMRVKLESVSPPKVQNLDSHPDVRVAGEGGRRAQAQAEEEKDAEEEVYPVIIRVRSTNPFWVRREDLAAQLEADLTVRIAQTTQISGRVELIRGFFELVGKRFELDKGYIQFTGGDQVNPVVDLEATYDLGAGEELTVRITGDIQNPQLSFSSTTGEVNNIGDAIALLMGGRSGGATQQGVEQEASSVLAGVTAGILTTTLRRELGDLFPVISVETGDRFGTGMVRAGLSADRLVPDFLEDVVRSVYVEGFVGSGGEEGGAQPQGSDTRGGFLVELRWPYDMTTTATFEPPAGWSLDLLWEP